MSVFDVSDDFSRPLVIRSLRIMWDYFFHNGFLSICMSDIASQNPFR